MRHIPASFQEAARNELDELENSRRGRILPDRPGLGRLRVGHERPGGLDSGTAAHARRRDDLPGRNGAPGRLRRRHRHRGVERDGHRHPGRRRAWSCSSGAALHATPFHWQNATVYFALTDRFHNGDPTNDGSYGRKKDGASEIGTWHGGDWKGLTAKLPYLADLGVTALWISPIVEQVHGWVAGGTGDFKHYGYAGYWALDFTRLDANWGTAADLQELVDQAHQRGIRVMVDVVLNHPGYATGADLLSYLPEVFHDGTGAAFTAYDAAPHADLRTWNDLVNYQSTGWTNWWSPAWIRAGSTPQEFPGFDRPGTDDLTKSLTFLPDFKTEATAAAGIPDPPHPEGGHAGRHRGDARSPGATVRDYLVKWQTDWVRQFGIDGFRCDTAKNVELGSWKALKTAGTAALADWKAANPGKAMDGSPFWMTGEVYGHGVIKDSFFVDGGFDSLINFAFQPQLRDALAVKPALVDNADELDALYGRYSAAVSDPSFGILSYLSSHDTRLWFGDIALNDAAKQRQAGTALLLAPGGVQVFYGDESGRRLGPSRQRRPPRAPAPT